VGLKMSYGDEAMGYAYFETGSTGIELFERNAFAQVIGEPTPVAAPTGRQFVLDFQVDDVDATYAQLIERGAASVQAPTDRPEWGNVRAAQLADPEGNIVEMYSPIASPDSSKE
jgi:lactoylglutathione lyase